MTGYARPLLLTFPPYKTADNPINAGEPVGSLELQKYHAKKVDIFEKSHDEMFNGGIIIPFTCNFETFIFPVKDGECYVESCNNHPWEEIFPDMFEDDSEYRHYNDDETLFTDVNTNTTTTTYHYHYF